jgi:hypothetical protein
VNGNPVSLDLGAPAASGVKLDVAAGASVAANAAHGVLAGIALPDAYDTLRVSAVNGSSAGVGQAIADSSGTLTLNADGSYNYSAGAGSAPAPYGFALDTFTFKVSDGDGDSATAALSILL